MSIIEDIKMLISDGKTADAIDALHELLKNKDDSLSNQVYLLRSQFREIENKMRIGVEVNPIDINRINNSLLYICDDYKKLKPKPIQRAEIAEPTASIWQNPMVKYGAIAGVVLLILIALIFLIRNKDTQAPDSAAQWQWQANPTTVDVRENGHNNMQVEITGISLVSKNNTQDLLTIKLMIHCLADSSDACVENDLKYVLRNPSTDLNLSRETTTETKIEGGANLETSIDFDIPKDSQSTLLDIYYANKLKRTIVLQ